MAAFHFFPVILVGLKTLKGCQRSFPCWVTCTPGDRGSGSLDEEVVKKIARTSGLFSFDLMQSVKCGRRLLTLSKILVWCSDGWLCSSGGVLEF